MTVQYILDLYCTWSVVLQFFYRSNYHFSNNVRHLIAEVKGEYCEKNYNYNNNKSVILRNNHSTAVNSTTDRPNVISRKNVLIRELD